MPATVDRKKLFWASCLALLVTSLFFGMPITFAKQPGSDFGLNVPHPEIADTAVWGLAIAVVVGMISDAMEGKDYSFWKTKQPNSTIVSLVS